MPLRFEREKYASYRILGENVQEGRIVEEWNRDDEDRPLWRAEFKLVFRRPLGVEDPLNRVTRSYDLTCATYGEAKKRVREIVKEVRACRQKA